MKKIKAILYSSISMLIFLGACEKNDDNQVSGEEQPYPVITSSDC